MADEVADRIREAIFSGVYPPGAALGEAELASALRVSRGPVREALLLLQREGLVHSEWHRRSTVATLSADDIAEIDSLRDTLERLAVERAVTLATDDDLAAIERATDLMTHADGEHELVQLDIDFHDAVFAAAHHRRLREAWQAIRSQVHLFLLTRIGISAVGYLALLPAEHRELVVALRSRDAQAAVGLFATHRAHALKVLTTDHTP
jgi:DNA-binding GntR family transcriptional regulator